MAVRIRFRKFYECDTEAERSLEFGLDSLIYCLDTLKYYKIEDGFYTEVPPDEIFFTSPVSLSKLQISGTPDGTKYLRDDGSWSTPDGSGGSGIPGGLTTQVQFNDGGVFGGDAGLTYDKTNNIIGLESIDFSTTHTATSAERRLNWDNDEGSLVLTLKGGNITIPLGQEIATLVYNAEATTLTKGEVVYAFGASGQRVSVKRARNLSDSTSAQTLGIVAETIASGTEGFVMVQGMIRGLNTIGYTQGNALYLSSTYGQFTNVKQSAPNHLVYLGFVVKVHATAGEIFVKCQNGYELDEIHDVQIVSKQNGDVISYDSVSGLWKNVQPSVGHTIQDNGTNETQRTNLNFQRMLVTDDAGNNATIVARPADTFVGITAPASPVEGDVWTNSETWKSYKYYDGFWVETSNINASAVSGTGTTNELAYFSGTSTIASLATGTYPSLTELSYAKGVTSAIQTQLNAKLSGTGTSGQVAYWNGTTTQTGSSTFTFTPTTSLLVNNSITASGAIARGINFTPALTAAANNDVLVGLDINPTYSIGAFTGVSRFPLRIQGTTNTNFFNTGNIGVNTATDAGYKLDVNGTARVQVTGGSILFGNLAANYPAISFNGTLSSTDYNFGSGTTDKTFFINAPSGFNVSIRNNNGERLSVTGTNTIFYPVTGGSIILGGTSGSYSGLSFNGTMSSTDYNFLSQATDKTLFINVPTGYSHKFRVNNVDVIQIDSASITFSDAKNIILNTTTGTKIGTATTQKLGFFNATPVVQPSSVTTSQGIADALTSLGLLSSSSITTTPDVGGKLYLFNSY